MILVDWNQSLAAFYGLAACSWVPHWACHYYRLETKSTFKVGSWNFSVAHSLLSLTVYSVLIVLSLISISFEPTRTISALSSGVGHISLGSLHAYRLSRPFRFEVFGHHWSQSASLREALIVIPFGLLCLWVAVKTL